MTGWNTERKGSNDRWFLTLVRDNPPPCTTADPEIFFPESELYYEEFAQDAKSVCQRCPIVAECLEWALQVDDRFAVLGATTPAERSKMRRRKAA